MEWEFAAKTKFDQLIAKLPFFHRHIAEQVVTKKAAELAEKRGSPQIGEPDLAQAFRTEVPEVFRTYLDQMLKEVDLS